MLPTYKLPHYELICTVCLAAVICGCGNISESYNDYKYKGSNVGYTLCIEKNKNKGISDQVVEVICRKKHIQSINPTYSAGGSYTTEYGFSLFKGWLKNKSDNKIITSFTITIKHEDNKDNSGKPIEERQEIDGLWVEPLQVSGFSSLPLNYTPSIDRRMIDGKPLYSWSISEMKGINVNLE
jgi:hypothetical protein